MKILGIEFAPLRIPLSRRIETFAVWQFAFSFIFLGFGFLFLFIYLLFTSLYYIPLLYFAWYMYDRRTSARGGRRVEWARKWRVWKHYCNYFPLKLHKTAELDPKKNYIFACHPHGVMCLSHFVNFGTEGSNFGEIFPGIRSYLLSLAGQFMFPVFREYFMMTGVAEISKDSVEYLLSKNGTGNAIAIIVGGASEALDAAPGHFVLKLQSRKGFCKMALKHGADICPVFSFGENDIFSQLANPEGSYLRSLQEFLKRHLGFSLPIIKGRGVFQYNFGLTPFRRPINTVVGKPLNIMQTSDPTNEQVEDLHKDYMAALIDLFETNKTKYGVGEDDHLIIR